MRCTALQSRRTHLLNCSAHWLPTVLGAKWPRWRNYTSPCWLDAILSAFGDGTIQATSVGGRNSRFGIPADALLARLAVRPNGVSVTGLHAHVGSQGCTLDQLVDGATALQRVRAGIDALDGASPIEFVDIGGGLPTNYGTDTNAPTIGDYAHAQRTAVPGLFDGGCADHPAWGRMAARVLVGDRRGDPHPGEPGQRGRQLGEPSWRSLWCSLRSRRLWQ